MVPHGHGGEVLVGKAFTPLNPSQLSQTSRNMNSSLGGSDMAVSQNPF